MSDKKKVDVKMHSIDLGDLKDKHGHIDEDMLDTILEGALKDLPADMVDELKETLKAEGILDEINKDGFANDTAAQEALLNHFALTTPPVGALVKRNAYGLKEYKFPRVEKNRAEAAIVMEKFCQYTTDIGGNPVNGVIAVAEASGRIGTYLVDLRGYEQLIAGGKIN